MRRAHQSVPTQFVLGGNRSQRGQFSKVGGMRPGIRFRSISASSVPALVPGSGTRLRREGITTGPRSGTKGAVAGSVAQIQVEPRKVSRSARRSNRSWNGPRLMRS